MATARGTEAEIVRSLDAGADDYVVKPFGGGPAGRPDPGGAAPRPPSPREDPVLEVGGLRVDPRARQAPWTAPRWT